MTVIERHGPHATLINVFTVEPQQASALAALLDDATERVMRHVPGFVSANIHVSTDGTRVVNYAQWESAEAYRAMLATPPHANTCRRPPTSQPASTHISTSSNPCTSAHRRIQNPRLESRHMGADFIDVIDGYFTCEFSTWSRTESPQTWPLQPGCYPTADSCSSRRSACRRRPSTFAVTRR